MDSKEFWPQSIYPEAKTVIVIGLPVQLPIVETAPSIYYHELYKTVSNALDSRAYEISNGSKNSLNFLASQTLSKTRFLMH